MGKYALLLVAGFSVAGAKLIFSTQETDVKASQGQSEYDADLIAREIARSAYNAAVADANLEGTDIPAALLAVGPAVVSETQTLANKCAGGVPVCYRREGTMQGGRFRVEASVTGGNRVDVYARGQYDYTTVQNDRDKPNYGRQVRMPKVYEINEMRAVGVLQVARSGLLSIQFIDSMAGYCSAIFLRRTLPGVPAALQPAPEMVYAPGKKRNGDRNTGFETELAPGTQMNFGIGIDTNCNSGGSRPTSRPDLRMDAASRTRASQGPNALKALMDGYIFAEADWANIHWALDAGSLQNGDPQEGPWAMVETDPANNQRWRISFEDIHNWNLLPSDPNYNRPRSSLWATKRFGYDTNNDGRGDGWKDVERTEIRTNSDGSYTVVNVAGQDGFHDLEDYGSWPDFSDQVIMVQITPPTTRVPA